MEFNSRVIIYTDGSCFPNPGGAGGWAAIVRMPNANEMILQGSADSTTNNRMELTAVIESLVFLGTLDLPVLLSEIQIHSDSTYVCNPINTKKVVKWSKEEKRTNRDLWQDLASAIMQFRVPVKAVWVRGHAGHPENERCDQMAESQREERGGARPKDYPPYDSGKPIKVWNGKRALGKVVLLPKPKRVVKMPMPELRLKERPLTQARIRACRDEARKIN